jgi:hypothetical protein
MRCPGYNRQSISLQARTIAGVYDSSRVMRETPLIVNGKPE